MPGEVAVYSGNDEIRLLLRGLLKLHHFSVVREGSLPASLVDLPKERTPVVVLDADLDEVGWSEAIQLLRSQRPELRMVLLTATRSPRIGNQAKAIGIDAVVQRPFPVHALLEAVGGEDGASTAPTSGDPSEGAPEP